jgi:hypothetical protein
MKKGTRPPAKLKTVLAAQRRQRKLRKTLDGLFLRRVGIVVVDHYAPGLLRPNPAFSPSVVPEGVKRPL